VKGGKKKKNAVFERRRKNEGGEGGREFSATFGVALVVARLRGGRKGKKKKCGCNRVSSVLSARAAARPLGKRKRRERRRKFAHER